MLQATDGIYATPERVIASIMSKLVALSQGCVWYNVDSSREQMKTVLVCRYAARLDVTHHLRDLAIQQTLMGLSPDQVLLLAFVPIGSSLPCVTDITVCQHPTPADELTALCGP